MDDIASMSWIGLVLAIVAAYFAIKVVKFVMKIAFWLLVLFGAYWFLAPKLDLPTPW
jgi:uncharacterized membrane protein YfhO